MPADSTRTAAASRTADASRNANGGVTSETPPDPPTVSAPSGLTAQASSTQVALNWSDVDGATYYRVEQSTTSATAGFSQINSDGVTTASALTVTGLSNGTQYWFRIKAAIVQGSNTYVSDYSSVVTATPASTSGGALTLTATFESVMIELPFTGTASTATGTVGYSTTGGAPWTEALPLHVVDDGAGYKAMLGAVVNLTANTAYTVQITQTVDSVQTVLTDAITTRAENITAVASLVATHYVRSTGSDGAAGTSSGTAWATINKAITYFNATGGNMVVDVVSDIFSDVRETINAGVTGTFTLVNAATPAVNDSQAEINTTAHTILQFKQLAPGSSWTTEQFVGPVGGATYNMWTYTVPNGVAPEHLSYSTTARGSQTVIGQWKNNLKLANGVGATDAGIVEFMHVNSHYRYGWFPSKTNASKFILRMPPDSGTTDPNDLYMLIGRDFLITSKANGTASGGAVARFSGIEFRGANNGLVLKEPAHHHVVDHCLFQACRYMISIDATKSPSIVYGSDHVIQRNLFRQRNLRALPGDSITNTIPWTWVKGKSEATGYTQWARAGEQTEGKAIHGEGGALRTVIRYCTVDGTFNGQGGKSVGYDRYANSGVDVHNCTFKNIADDSVGEHEKNCMLLKVWNNRFEYVSVMFSSAPGNYGPTYIWRNSVYMWGPVEIVGQLTEPDNKGVGPLVFKTSGDHSVTPLIYFVHNTCFTSQVGPTPFDSKFKKGQWPDGVQNVGSGLAGHTRPKFYWRNNLILAYSPTPGGYGAALRGTFVSFWNEDYCMFGSSTGNEMGSTMYTAVADYRTASGGGTHSNVGAASADISLIDMTAIKAMLNDPDNGDLTLATNSLAINKGVVVPNLTVSHQGAAPDIGYAEKA